MCLRGSLQGLLLAGCGLGLLAQAPATSSKLAGTVSDLVPRVQLRRAAAQLEVHLRDSVFLQDVLETERRSRVRVELVDGSVVNVGPRSRFLVTEMNETSQQTALLLEYGRLRAEVKKRSQPGGKFEVRTRTGVSGVVGTTHFVAAFPEETIVANLSRDPTARIWVRSSNPAIPLTVILKPGYGTSVGLDAPPGQPSLWGKERIQRALDDSREFRP